MTTHGGPRPRSGPKPKPPETLRVPYGTKLDPQVVAFLRTLPKATEFLDNAVMRSKAFKEWQKNNSQ